jgi:hypothetical protein
VIGVGPYSDDAFRLVKGSLPTIFNLDTTGIIATAVTATSVAVNISSAVLIILMGTVASSTIVSRIGAITNVISVIFWVFISFWNRWDR